MRFDNNYQKGNGNMTEKIKETEVAALNAAKDKLDAILAPLSKEERNTMICLLLEAMK